MADKRVVSYLRVSSKRQGRSGLGLEAQRADVERFLKNGVRWSLVAEFVEVESGTNNHRPKLADALATCRAYGATLLVAKLDRLSRDAHFLLGLAKAGVDFVAVDMPEANQMTVGVMAVVAQHERDMTSARTKAALQAAKARGARLGGLRGRKPDDTIYGPNLPAVATAATAAAGRSERSRLATEHAESLAPVLARLDPSGTASLRKVAKLLNDDGVRAPSAWRKVAAAKKRREAPDDSGGPGVWTAATVARLRARLNAVPQTSGAQAQ